MLLNPNSEIRYNRYLFWLGVFSLVWMTLLLFAGGATTSIRAGMAFLDWPLSNGSLNPEGWTTKPDQLAEHSHRLLGMKMGLLSIIMAVLCQIYDRRGWVRKLAWSIVGVIILQGVLGGLRVLLDEQNIQVEGNWIAQVFLILHATGAQVTLCMWVTLVIALSRQWIAGDRSWLDEVGPEMFRIGVIVMITLTIQLLWGAMVRHFHAATIFANNFPFLTANLQGLSSILPDDWNLQVFVHFMHRAWAWVVFAAIAWFYYKIWANKAVWGVLGKWMIAGKVLFFLQILLGALVVWTFRNPHAATVHTLIGAAIMAINWSLTFWLGQGKARA